MTLKASTQFSIVDWRQPLQIQIARNLKLYDRRFHGRIIAQLFKVNMCHYMCHYMVTIWSLYIHKKALCFR